jgi:hypothetical protein
MTATGKILKRELTQAQPAQAQPVTAEPAGARPLAAPFFRPIRTDTARTGNRAVSVPARAGAAPTPQQKEQIHA